MKIALVDVDGKIPNLALMKISAWHKSKGDVVFWYRPSFIPEENDLFSSYYLDEYSPPDRIYASKIFTFTKDFTAYHPKDPAPIKGGTGYDIERKLPEEIEAMSPDYSIYPQFHAAYGFLTRGCIRSCPWCVVPKKEGSFHIVNDLPSVAEHVLDRRGKRDVILLDNNFLAADDAFICDTLTFSKKEKVRLDFNQGLDARLVDDFRARYLAAANWVRFIRFSCDTHAMLPEIERAVSKLRKAGSHRPIFCYMLVKDDLEEAEERLRFLVKLGITPFAQAYRSLSVEDYRISKAQRNFCSFANVKGGKMCLKMKFSDYYH